LPDEEAVAGFLVHRLRRAGQAGLLTARVAARVAERGK
jgi:hypothetical protein